MYVLQHLSHRHQVISSLWVANLPTRPSSLAGWSAMGAWHLWDIDPRIYGYANHTRSHSWHLDPIHGIYGIIYGTKVSWATNLLTEVFGGLWMVVSANSREVQPAFSAASNQHTWIWEGHETWSCVPRDDPVASWYLLGGLRQQQNIAERTRYESLADALHHISGPF